SGFEHAIFIGALTGFHFTVGSYSASATGGFIHLLNEPAPPAGQGDFFLARPHKSLGLIGAPVNGLHLEEASFLPRGPSGGMMMLAVNLPSELDFSLPKTFGVRFSDGTRAGFLQGDISTASEGPAPVAPVPIPAMGAAVPALVVAFGGLIAWR